MPTTYANSINNNPIYADRAEKDAAGNTISTTYATKQEIPTIVGLAAGPCVAITEANNTVTIGVSTTAGITDIQQVNVLPAQPVATVLYLIPET